jgi:ABC-2 type transport system permease protein
MQGPGRYLRVFAACARFSLATEMSFRANFLVKLVVEALWFSILIAFCDLVFRRTQAVAGWDFHRYLFFIGCHYALAGVIETFFLENCTEFAELVRTGDLDLYLLRPIDEQFLITIRRIDWSAAPNILMGAFVMAFALAAIGWHFDAGLLAAFLVLFACGVAMTYSFLVLLCSLSVWMVRNQSLLEMWWLFTTLMRYPREVFQGGWATPFGRFFTYIVPVMLVVSVPADTMVRTLQPQFVALTAASAVLLLVASRYFFRHALKSYRSASS